MAGMRADADAGIDSGGPLTTAVVEPPIELTRPGDPGQLALQNSLCPIGSLINSGESRRGSLQADGAIANILGHVLDELPRESDLALVAASTKCPVVAFEDIGGAVESPVGAPKNPVGLVTLSCGFGTVDPQGHQFVGKLVGCRRRQGLLIRHRSTSERRIVE